MDARAAIALAGLLLAAQAHAADVGVSIRFSQPGVFGRVDIGDLPQPQLIVPQPVFVVPPPVGLPPPEPVYMWVPPEHRQHWRQYCRQYHACDRPVYFVHDDWYHHNVADARGHPVGPHRDYGRDERHGDRDDHGHGHDDHGRDDHGHGHGHDDDRDRGRGRD